MSRYFYFRTEPFTGRPVELAEHLAAFGVRLRQPDWFSPCVEYRDGDGRRVREIGDVTVYEDGRIRIWPHSDATPAEQVVLLRAAERVITHGLHGAEALGWEERVTEAGRVYHRCCVCVFVDDSEAGAAAAGALNQRDVDEQFMALAAAGELS
jgi:hypothetical protein